MVNVWFFTTDARAAYDITQTNGKIKDGDVLVVPNDGVVGIMVEAWPTAVTAEYGAFHAIREDAHNSEFVQKYIESFKIAWSFTKGETWNGKTILVIDTDKLEEKFILS